MTNKIKLELYPPDHKIFTEGVRMHGMPSKAKLNAITILICGDRNWIDFDLIHNTLKTCHTTFRCQMVIEGGAKGADMCGREAAMTLNIPYQEFRARWEDYGKGAGPIRNQQMLDEGQPDVVLAFHDDLPNSKGTKDMIRRAKKAGIPVRHYSHKEPHGTILL
jgi:hypothetical protein